MSKLFDGKTLRDLLNDMTGIKLSRVDRIHVLALQRRVVLSIDEVQEGWKLVRRFARKLRELHEARERAKVSCARQQLGMTVADVVARQVARSAQAKKERESGL